MPLQGTTIDENFSANFKVIKWTDSDKTYVRRAGPVSLLESKRSFNVNCSIDKVFQDSEKPKQDPEIHAKNSCKKKEWEGGS